MLTVLMLMYLLLVQERALMQTEMAELRRRVNKAEKDLLGAKEECLLLTSNIQTLEREVSLFSLLFWCIIVMRLHYFFCLFLAHTYIYPHSAIR